MQHDASIERFEALPDAVCLVNDVIVEHQLDTSRAPVRATQEVEELAEDLCILVLGARLAALLSSAHEYCIGRATTPHRVVRIDTTCDTPSLVHTRLEMLSHSPGFVRATAAELLPAVLRYATLSFASSLAFIGVALGAGQVLCSSKRSLPDVGFCWGKTRYTSDGSSF